MATRNNADRIYGDVKKMAMHFDIKPDEKLNETSLAKSLGASRTPLREALNRLASEGFLNFEKGRGYFGRSLNVNEVIDLYQAREAVECKAAELACERATQFELDEMANFHIECERRYKEDGTTGYLLEFDEAFHMKMTQLSGNNELIRLLENINARMRYVRIIDLQKSRVASPNSHLDILQAIIDRDAKAAVTRIRAHIEFGSADAAETVRRAYSRIYVPG